MSLKHGLLGLLNYGSMTGYELDKAFKASLSFFWQAKTSQIYRELDAMERGGWLTSERVIQNEKPNKRVYTLTEAGKAELQQWLSSPETDLADAMRVRSAFLMRVFFAGETSREQALSMLRTYRNMCRQGSASMYSAYDSIAEYRAAVNDGTKTQYWKIAALYGEMFLRTGEEWAERAIAMLEVERK